MAALLVACDSHSGTTAAVNQPVAVPQAVFSAAREVGHVGDTLNLTNQEGHPMAVMLVEVINPAPFDPSIADVAATYVAMRFTLVNTGETGLVGDANNNAALVGSDNHSYAPVVGDTEGCANFRGGIYQLSAGDSTTGCVTFALPAGVSPQKVKYLPSAGFADDVGVWAIPPA